MDSSIVAIALQQRLQKAKLVARIAERQEHANLFVADRDDAALAIVVAVGFIVAGGDFDDVGDVAGRGGPMREKHGLRFAVRAERHRLFGQRRRTSPSRRQHDLGRLAVEAGGLDLDGEADEVVDEHGIVDQHVGQLDVAGRASLPRPTARSGTPRLRAS